MFDEGTKNSAGRREFKEFRNFQPRSAFAFSGYRLVWGVGRRQGGSNAAPGPGGEDPRLPCLCASLEAPGHQLGPSPRGHVSEGSEPHKGFGRNPRNQGPAPRSRGEGRRRKCLSRARLRGGCRGDSAPGTVGLGFASRCPSLPDHCLALFPAFALSSPQAASVQPVLGPALRTLSSGAPSPSPGPSPRRHHPAEVSPEQMAGWLGVGWGRVPACLPLTQDSHPGQPSARTLSTAVGSPLCPCV